MKENSIEEDIKRAQYFINSIKADEDYKNENGWNGYYNKEIVELARILEHILSDYKRVLKENEELKEKNDSLELEEKRRTIGKYGEFEIHEVINKVLADDYIPVQKVKDKIEELNNNKEEYMFYKLTSEDIRKIVITNLQELIEEREKKRC